MLADRPGELLKALQPIARNGGNIISIIHEREGATGTYVPVSLIVDFPSYENFRKARMALEDLDINIIKSEEVVERVRFTVLLIGRFDLKKILEAKIKDLKITGFEVSAPTSKEFCVRLNIEVPKGEVDSAVNELKKISREENVLFISSL